MSNVVSLSFLPFSPDLSVADLAAQSDAVFDTAFMCSFEESEEDVEVIDQKIGHLLAEFSGSTPSKQKTAVTFYRSEAGRIESFSIPSETIAAFLQHESFFDFAAGLQGRGYDVYLMDAGRKKVRFQDIDVQLEALTIPYQT